MDNVAPGGNNGQQLFLRQLQLFRLLDIEEDAAGHGESVYSVQEKFCFAPGVLRCGCVAVAVAAHREAHLVSFAVEIEGYAVP